jgi:S1-C subfamily serine protease
MNRDFLFKNEEEILTQVTKFFFASILQKDHFDKVVEICLKNPQIHKPNGHVLIQQGKFSLKDFFYYWSVLNPKGGLLKNVVIEELLRRFCGNHLLHRSDLFLSLGLDFYQVNEPLAKFFLERDALENLAFDFSHLVEKYSKSILHFVVTDKNGDIWNGTGFLTGSKSWVVTNKHVIEEDAKQLPRVLAITGQELSVKKIHCSKSDDLALVELVEPFEGRPFFLMPQVESLDEIVTMGYPRIPLAKASPMVAHKGEINGHASLMYGDRLLFSAKTAPGNSGGPLINRAGLVVGIVTEDLQSEQAKANNIQPYFAAIPSVQLIVFVQEVIGLKAELPPAVK